MGTDRDEEMEIDLQQLFFLLRRRIWVILLAVLIGASAAMLYTTNLIEPVYTSSTMIYILNKTNSITSLSDLQLGTQLTKDYKVLVTSRPVLNQVIENLGLDGSYQQLKSRISVNNPADTRILTISVNDADPHIARSIADEMANVSVGRIAEIMDSTPPKIVEDASLPTAPTSPSVKKNTALGGLAAGALAAGVITLLYLLNDRIQTTADIERYLGINSLGVIPCFEDNEKGKRNNLFKRKRRPVS